MKAGKVIVFANQKGGVAKTTSAVMTAGCMTQRGMDVLLIDTDPQGNATDYVTPELNKSKGNIYDVLMERCSLLEAIEYGTNFGDVLPASETLAEDMRALDNDPFLLAKHLQSVKCNYDYIIIDTPPTLGMILLSALMSADCIVIPTLATAESIKGINSLIETIGKYKKYNPNMYIGGFLINRSNQRVKAVKYCYKQLMQASRAIGCVVFNNWISNAEALFGEAELYKLNIFQEMKLHKVKNQYGGFVDELLEVMSK